MFLKLSLSLLLCGAALISATIYDGYKIYDINARNDAEKKILRGLAENDDLDFFALPRLMGVPARVMVQPQDQNSFETALNKYGLKHVVVNDNVGVSVKLELLRNTFMRSVSDSTNITFTSFLRFHDINAYLDQLALRYPSRVNVTTAGKTFEGRDLKTITISNGDGVTNKPVILIDAGIHAREWIAPAEALYIIHQLVEKFAANAHLVETYDWVVLPVVNPDGYEYTHTTTRMWRKTRQPVTGECYGTDANHNFDFHWDEVGTSRKSCADTYRGPSPFSEPETRVIRDLMHSLSGRTKLYLTLHSYGNYLLYPWGYTKELPKNWREIHEVAQAGAAAIKAATGTRYTVGSSNSVHYDAAGGSEDYALAVAKIPLSISMELPAGGSGFDPSPSQIHPFVEETWIGVKAMAEKVIFVI